MLSEANLAAIEDAGLRFIVGARIPDIPYQIAEWRRQHSGQPLVDGQIFVQPWVMGSKADRRVRDGRLSPAMADREELPHVQDRPPRTADLPPQEGLDRGPPHHRVRR